MQIWKVILFESVSYAPFIVLCKASMSMEVPMIKIEFC